MSNTWLSRLSEEDSISAFGSIFTDPDEGDLKMLDKVKVIMDSLPPIEADFIDLYFFRHIRQTDIAGIFGVSQPTVCYRLQRAIQRIKYLLEVPQVDLAVLRRDLAEVLEDPMDVDIMVFLYESTCQSEAAKRLGVSQGLVRHRFLRSVEKMKKTAGMEFYADIFDHVSKNLNILREVRRPIPSARSGVFIDS